MCWFISLPSKSILFKLIEREKLKMVKKKSFSLFFWKIASSFSFTWKKLMENFRSWKTCSLIAFFPRRERRDFHSQKKKSTETHPPTEFQYHQRCLHFYRFGEFRCFMLCMMYEQAGMNNFIRLFFRFSLLISFSFIASQL